MLELKLEDFSPVALTDRAVIQPLLLAEDPCFCEYSFANLFMWGEIFATRWLLREERLWLYNGRDDMMLMPLGRALAVPELVAAADGLRRQGKSGSFVLVDPDYVQGSPELERFFHIELDPDNGDYIYSSRKLVNLQGNKLHKKRNQINQFLGLYPGHVSRPLRASDLEPCLQLAEKWCRLRTCDALDFDHETSALKRALLNFDELELRGIVVELDGRLAAFAVYSRLNSTMADVHFEKFDPEVKGIGQVINWETAKALAGDYKYINREQDLGLEGLRQAKRSYDPEYVLGAYLLERKN